MNNLKRQQNEHDFDHWEDLAGGSRKYWFEVKGKTGGKARYDKNSGHA